MANKFLTRTKYFAIIDSVTTHINTHKEKIMTEVTKQFEQMVEQFKAAIPQVKPNKNGYEIRTKILELAKDNVWQDYYAKWGAFETSIKKEHDEIVTKVEMPVVPGADKVLEAAEKFYAFVNNAK